MDEIPPLPEVPMSVLRRIAQEQGVNPDEVVSIMQREAESRPPFDRLKAFQESLWTSFQSAELLNVEGREGVLVIGAAWAAVAFRQARATFLLWELGMKDAASSTSRVALEHSVYVSLLASSSDPQKVIDSFEDRYLGMLERLVESADDDVMDLLTKLSGHLPSRDTLATERWQVIFEQVCNKFETGEIIYLHYRMLCAEVHPGFGTAAPYILPNVPVGGSQPYALSPDFTLGSDLCLLLAVDSGVWAGWSLDSLFGVEIFDPVATSVAMEMGIHRLRLKQT